MDAIRDGLVNRARAECPEDPSERARHLKAFGHFADASMVGIGPVPQAARLAEPLRNPEIDRLAQDLRTRQTRTLASGIDAIMADLKESMEAPPSGIAGHGHAAVFLVEMPRDPRPREPGTEWLADAQAHRIGCGSGAAGRGRGACPVAGRRAGGAVRRAALRPRGADHGVSAGPRSAARPPPALAAGERAGL